MSKPKVERVSLSALSQENQKLNQEVIQTKKELQDALQTIAKLQNTGAECCGVKLPTEVNPTREPWYPPPIPAKTKSETLTAEVEKLNQELSRNYDRLASLKEELHRAELSIEKNKLSITVKKHELSNALTSPVPRS